MQANDACTIVEPKHPITSIHLYIHCINLWHKCKDRFCKHFWYAECACEPTHAVATDSAMVDLLAGAACIDATSRHTDEMVHT